MVNFFLFFLFEKKKKNSNFENIFTGEEKFNHVMDHSQQMKLGSSLEEHGLLLNVQLIQSTMFLFLSFFLSFLFLFVNFLPFFFL